MRAALRLIACVLLAVTVAGCDERVREEVAACDAKGDTVAVLELCATALELSDLSEDERIEVLFARASVHGNRGDWAAARADIQAIGEIDASSPYVPRGLAYIEMNSGNLEEALRLYDEAILLDPENAGLVGLRGYARYRLQQYEKAVEDLTFAIDPPGSMRGDEANLDFFRQARGISLVEMGRHADAVEDLDHWIAQNPSEPWGLAYRGLTRMEQGRLREAISDFDAAIANGGTAAWLRKLLPRDDAIFYGPENASYETGVRYALETLARITEEFPGLEEDALTRRREELFPDRLFSNGKFLLALETGIAPLRLAQSESLDRAGSSFYYAVLINTLNDRGDATCRAVVKSLDQFAAGLAASNDVLSLMRQVSSGAEFLAGLAVLLIGAAVIEEQAMDDAAMLAARHGCASDVVVNVLENGAKYLAWSMSL